MKKNSKKLSKIRRQWINLYRGFRSEHHSQTSWYQQRYYKFLCKFAGRELSCSPVNTFSVTNKLCAALGTKLYAEFKWLYQYDIRLKIGKCSEIPKYKDVDLNKVLLGKGG